MTMARSALTGGRLSVTFPDEVSRIRFSVLMRHKNGKLYIGHVVTALSPLEWADLHGHHLIKAFHIREAGPYERTKLL
jgi:phosphatidylserine decarboxylase